MNLIKVQNRCCCCGKIFTPKYKKGDYMAKAFAESCDICPECHIADCEVLTGENCNVIGEKQYQLRRKDTGFL